MRFLLFISVIFLGLVTVTHTVDIVSGCSSRCSILFEKNLSCFNDTLNYFQQILMGTMRYYMAAQVNIKNLSPNQVPDIRDSLVQQTIDQMNKVKIANVEAEDNVLNTAQATPIVQALVDNFLSLPKLPNQPAYCPIGCEKSRSPFDWLFYISVGVNGILVLLCGAALVIRAIKEEMFGRRKVAHMEHFITEHNKKREHFETDE